MGEIAITKKIHDLEGLKGINLISTSGSNPFDPWNGLTAKFYIEQNITFSNFLSNKQFDPIKNNFLVVKENELYKTEVVEFINNHHLKRITQSIPEFFVPFLKMYGGYPTNNILILYGE